MKASFFCIKHVINFPCHGKFISKDFRTTQIDHESDQHFVWFIKFWGFFSGSELMAKMQRNWNYIILEPENLEIRDFVVSPSCISQVRLLWSICTWSLELGCCIMWLCFIRPVYKYKVKKNHTTGREIRVWEELYITLVYYKANPWRHRNSPFCAEIRFKHSLNLKYLTATLKK